MIDHHNVAMLASVHVVLLGMHNQYNQYTLAGTRASVLQVILLHGF